MSTFVMWLLVVFEFGKGAGTFLLPSRAMKLVLGSAAGPPIVQAVMSWLLKVVAARSLGFAAGLLIVMTICGPEDRKAWLIAYIVVQTVDLLVTWGLRRTVIRLNSVSGPPPHRLAFIAGFALLLALLCAAAWASI